MVRAYLTSSKASFKTWKAVYLKQKQREALLLRFIQHYRKKNFDIVKGAFKNFIAQEKRKERKQRRKVMQVQVEE